MKLCLLLDFLIFFLNSDILKVDEIKENRIFFFLFNEEAAFRNLLIGVQMWFAIFI